MNTARPLSTHKARIRYYPEYKQYQCELWIKTEGGSNCLVRGDLSNSQLAAFSSFKYHFYAATSMLYIYYLHRKAGTLHIYYAKLDKMRFK